MRYFLNNRKAHAGGNERTGSDAIIHKEKNQIGVRMDLDSLQHLEKLGLLKQRIVS